MLKYYLPEIVPLRPIISSANAQNKHPICLKFCSLPKIPRNTFDTSNKNLTCLITDILTVNFKH